MDSRKKAEAEEGDISRRDVDSKQSSIGSSQTELIHSLLSLAFDRGWLECISQSVAFV